MTTEISYRERIPVRPDLPHPLGRHLNHDSRSLWPGYLYEADPATTLRSIMHVEHTPILNQLRLGSCVPNAGLKCMGTGLFYATVTASSFWHNLDESDVVNPLRGAYHMVTARDPYPGTWEPDDTGSDGLTMAKLLVEVGMIPGYQHANSLNGALAALMDRPWITGTYWRDDMFEPTAEGLVQPTGAVAGGHEYCAVGYDESRGWIWFANSWGPWGKDGRFAMEAEKYGGLLAQDGDVTIFTPLTEPAPQPAPDADHVFAEPLKKWMKHPRLFGSARLKAAGNEWLKAKGL